MKTSENELIDVFFVKLNAESLNVCKITYLEVGFGG